MPNDCTQPRAQVKADIEDATALKQKEGQRGGCPNLLLSPEESAIRELTFEKSGVYQHFPTALAQFVQGFVGVGVGALL